MKVKIIKKDFSFSNPYFDFDKYRFKIIPFVTDFSFGISYETHDYSTDIQKSENEPTTIDEKFIRKILILKNEFPVPDNEQIDLPNNFPHIYLYRGNFYVIDNTDTYTEDEKKLMIKEHYYKHNEKFKRLRREIELYESVETKSETMSREPIPENVRFSVWRRDEGKCVKCGCNQGLEFDHIIPFSKGGSNTERNLQLLCEKCNREKSSKI